jgi:hypothetical protein
MSTGLAAGRSNSRRNVAHCQDILNIHFNYINDWQQQEKLGPHNEGLHLKVTLASPETYKKPPLSSCYP